MKVTPTPLPGVLLIAPRVHRDERGLFCETFRAAALKEAGVATSFVQDNVAVSTHRHVLRGLHFQTGAAAQDKLIRVVRGRIFDAVVDLRPGSETFGRSFGCELSAESFVQLLAPAGFAHGYLTLEPDTEVFYKVSRPYAPEAEAGLLWSDPALGLDWPVDPAAVRINARDAAWPTLREWVAGEPAR